MLKRKVSRVINEPPHSVLISAICVLDPYSFPHRGNQQGPEVFYVAENLYPKALI
jgi:hypothetical protein